MTRLISIVGAPSPKLHGILNIVRALVQTTVGEHVVLVANSLEALREQFLDKSARNGQAVVLFSDYPQPDILAAFNELNAPVTVCVDEFTSVAHFSVVSRGFGAVEAARFATMGLVNVEQAVVSPPPTCLFVGDPKVETLVNLVKRLAEFYRIPMQEDSLAKVLASVGFAEQGEAPFREYIDRCVAAADKIVEDARASLESRSPLENELIDFLAGQYDGIARFQRLERLEWPVYALLRPEFPDRMTIGPIDLTGPARYIYYGPYFALPAGAWSAEVSFEVQDCLSDNQVALDVVADQILAIVQARLPPQGVYRCRIDFEIQDPSKPVEIRMQLLTGAIEGVIQLRRIELHRRGTLDDTA